MPLSEGQKGPDSKKVENVLTREQIEARKEKALSDWRAALKELDDKKLPREKGTALQLNAYKQDLEFVVDVFDRYEEVISKEMDEAKQAELEKKMNVKVSLPKKKSEAAELKAKFHKDFKDADMQRMQKIVNETLGWKEFSAKNFYFVMADYIPNKEKFDEYTEKGQKVPDRYKNYVEKSFNIRAENGIKMYNKGIKAYGEYFKYLKLEKEASADAGGN